MWAVSYTTDAIKVLSRLDPMTAKRIRAKILALAADPLSANNNGTKLVGVDGYRLRVGDWRVVYTLRRRVLTVIVIRIGHRSDIYR